MTAAPAFFRKFISYINVCDKGDYVEKVTQRIDVLGIAGSLREGSYNRALLRAARELAPGDVRVRLYDGLGDVPPYDQDRDVSPPPRAVADLRERISGADALLVATPEYNHSVPGVLKNAVDWASRPYGESSLQGKLAAVVGASPSRFGAKWAQEDLRKALEAAGAEVLEVGLPVSRAPERFDDAGRLTDDAVRRELAELLEELAEGAASRLAPCHGALGPTTTALRKRRSAPLHRARKPGSSVKAITRPSPARSS